MQCKHWMLVLAAAAIGFVGCTGSSGPAEDLASGSAETQPADGRAAQGFGQPLASGAVQAAPEDTSQPASAVFAFLDALRRGDDQKILAMYTARAREEVARVNQQFAPRGSDTAQFQVGEVEYINEAGARVACTWTDLDQDGQPHTLEFLWMVRREPAGWRVAGMAATPFPGEPPVLLDFENLEATIEKVNLLAEEIQRRDEMGTREARQPENSQDSLRR